MQSTIKKKQYLKLGADIYSLSMYSFFKDSAESLDEHNHSNENSGDNKIIEGFE